jgi:hypothetical protein
MATLDFSALELAARIAMMQPSSRLNPESDEPAPKLAIEEAPPTEPPIAANLVTCRALLQVDYGRAFATTILESNPSSATQPMQIMSKNPSRIRYEVVIANIAGAANTALRVGSQIAVQSGGGLKLSFQNNGVFYLVRDFKTDGDMVTAELWANAPTLTSNVSVRETILTPLPVDEL